MQTKMELLCSIFLLILLRIIDAPPVNPIYKPLRKAASAGEIFINPKIRTIEKIFLNILIPLPTQMLSIY